MAIPRSIHARLYYRCAERHWVEANVLLKAAQPTGAIYLAGYVAECALKSIIIESQALRWETALLDRFKRIGHNLNNLLEFYLQGRERHLTRKVGRPPAHIVRSFTQLGFWSSEMRYDPKTYSTSEAEVFLNAVNAIFQWLDGRL